MLDDVDVVAVHGFPLDWNHWQIHEWPDKLDEIRAVTELPVWVSEVGVSTFGAEEVQEFGLRRTRGAADRRAPSASTGTASTTCRARGRRRRATAKPRARPTTATSTWACCARTARPSARCAQLPELHAGDRASASGSTSRTTGWTTRVRWLKRARREAPAHRPELGRQPSAERGCLVRSPDAALEPIRRDRHLLLHARVERRRGAPSHQPAARSSRVRGVLRPDGPAVRAGTGARCRIPAAGLASAVSPDAHFGPGCCALVRST